MKRIYSFLLVLGSLASCGEPSTNTSERVENMTIQEKLAVLDGNNTPDTNDMKVIRIKFLLNDLSETYREPKDTIAEWTSKAQGVLHDNGIQESNLNILEEMNKTVKMENVPYRDAVTLYVMVRSKGF